MAGLGSHVASRVRMLWRGRLACVGACLVLLWGCDQEPLPPVEAEQDVSYQLAAAESPADRGERLFGINVSESERGFGPSFQVAQQAGVQLVELNIPWTAIEPAQGEYQDPWGVLAAIPFYGQNNVSVLFSLAVIDTARSTAPDYLKGKAWDSPEMIAAFNAMADWFLEHIPAGVDVPGLAIGNEVDLFLKADQWEPYMRFFEATRDHVRRRRPGLKIGVKTTVMAGALGRWASQVQAINEDTDVVMLNYYPQDAAFRVLEPEVVGQHFDRLAGLFEGRTIWLTELGYSSGGRYCGSSEAKQARFYHHMFTAWDRHREQIGLVLVNWLHDQSPTKIAQFKEYYGSSHPPFVEFLSTLGVRRYNHTDKAAWQQIVAETKARGW